MYRIKAFSNAQEFQELFGIQEHGNGIKSRRNKILLSFLKSKSVWEWCRENDHWELLEIKSMAQLKKVLTETIAYDCVNYGLRYVVQCDRRGSNDLITSICATELCSTEFIAATDFNRFGYHVEDGAMTDVLTLKENGLSVSCVNMSCGYYEPHTDHEYTVKSDLFNCLAFVEHIIENCTHHFPHEFDWYAGYGCRYDEFYYDFYDEIYQLVQSHPNITIDQLEAAFRDYIPKVSRNDLGMTLELVRQDLEYAELETDSYGTLRI